MQAKISVIPSEEVPVGTIYDVSTGLNVLASDIYIRGSNYDLFYGTNLFLSVRESVGRWRHLQLPYGTLTLVPHSVVSLVLAVGQLALPVSENLGTTVAVQTSYIIPPEFVGGAVFLPAAGMMNLYVDSASAGPPATYQVIVNLGDALEGDRTIQVMTRGQLTTAVSLTSARWVRLIPDLVRSQMQIGPTTAMLLPTIVTASTNNDFQFVCAQVPDPTNDGYVYWARYALKHRSPPTGNVTALVVGFALLNPAAVVADRASMSSSQAVVLTRWFTPPATHMANVIAAPGGDGASVVTGQMGLYIPALKTSATARWYAVAGFSINPPTTSSIDVNVTAFLPAHSTFAINGVDASVEVN